MDEVTRDCIVSLSAFAAIFGIAYIYFQTRHRERMVMMDKGIDLKSFQQQPLSLKYGMLSIGAAMGTLAGALLKHIGVGTATSYVSMVFLFSGISLVLFHIISRKQSS
jgi:hypothetical protein